MLDQIVLHEWVKLYNWDDGLVPIWPIVDSNETEHATALMIYWRLEGPYSVAKPGCITAGARQCLDLVRERLLAGFYRKGKLRYDPIADNQLSRTQVHLLRKGGVPDELIQPKYPSDVGESGL
jgi:hypothetical protein